MTVREIGKTPYPLYFRSLKHSSRVALYMHTPIGLVTTLRTCVAGH